MHVYIVLISLYKEMRTMKNLFFLDKAMGLWLCFFKKRTLILEIGTQMRDEIACLGLASKPPGTTGVYEGADVPWATHRGGWGGAGREGLITDISTLGSMPQIFYSKVFCVSANRQNSVWPRVLTGLGRFEEEMRNVVFKWIITRLYPCPKIANVWIVLYLPFSYLEKTV